MLSGRGRRSRPKQGDFDALFPPPFAVESKDYYSEAEQLAQQKKVEALLAADQRKLETQSSDRSPMRKLAGGMELQELVLK